MVFPDYDRSILSVSASILAHFGVQPRYPTLPELDAALAGKRKLLWVIADGLGSRALRRALPENAYLRRMTRATVTSVFPPTTTAATASYYSGKSPLEHGWLGWHLYFKEYAAEITTFTSTEYYTGSKRRVFPSPAGTLMPYETLFEQVRDPGLVTHALCGFPAWLERGADFTHRINSLEQGCAALRRIAQSDSSQFALMYWTQPDAEMHAHGTDSPQAKAQYRAVNDALERLSAQLFRDGCGDTLLLVTSDHGLVDVEETIDCAARPGLAQTLVLPPTIEARAASFFVKPHRMADFERWVQENLSGDFILMRRNEILESGLFGRGTPHAKFDDFVGDAMVIATGRRCLEYCPPGRAPEPLRARHAGLTEDEMLVDIMFDTGDMT